MIQEQEEFKINIIKCLFINYILVAVAFLIPTIVSSLPACMNQFVFYGKLNLKVDRHPWVRRLEIPKSWYRHFYIFAFVWSLLALGLLLNGITNGTSAPDCIMEFFDFFAGGKGRKVLIDSTSGVLAITLITIQVAGRVYETHFVQIFSSKSKMNLWHYIFAYVHYFGIIVVLLANTEGFVRASIPSPILFSNITGTQFICCLIFSIAWSQQRNSNKLLANLRKDETGKQNSEEHFMPRDGFFEYVSSPHMLFEVVMYLAICGIVPSCSTWWYVTIWVIANQTANAWETHRWYKKNIKDYPKARFAIYPQIL